MEPMGDYLFVREGFTATSGMTMPRELALQVPWDETLSFGDDADYAVRLAATGAELHMHAEPLVIMSDDESGDRLSRETDWQATLAWLNRIRPLISRRGYRCCLGWHVARQASQSGNLGTALRFYLRGVGAMPVRLKAKALVQILLPRRLYKLGDYFHREPAQG